VIRDDVALRRGSWHDLPLLHTAPFDPVSTEVVNPKIVNALTIDVEDYFQVSAFESRIPRTSWDEIPCRVESNVDRILSLLDDHGAKATFFTLGWIAERYPAVVRRIVAAGHELASHGYEHKRASGQQYGEMIADLRLAKAILEDVSGHEVRGYRAPSFSIGIANAWALQCIADAGHRYSSSVYPIRHDHYGFPGFSRFPKEVLPGFFEVPVSTIRLLGTNWPAGGGGYFRLFPYAVSKWTISRINRADRRPAMFYFHPWELDPDQPRTQGVSAKARFRHYLNLRRMQPRLSRLLTDFQWDRVDRAFPILGHTSSAPGSGPERIET
jgi:polysaccharide deacetylase family protein (PEP-CTERM system associated)